MEDMHMPTYIHLHRNNLQSLQVTSAQSCSLQAPAKAEDKAVWESAKAIMASSGQKLNLTDIACRRDMSMLLAQSAVQAGPWCTGCFCRDRYELVVGLNRA